jgi:PAS domain S-box-containing protein
MTAPQSAADRRTGGPRKTRARLALAFVAVTLIALAIVPIYLGQRAARAQEHITDQLQPALFASAELSLAQANLVDLLQRFLPDGEGSYRTRYNAAAVREDSLYADLGERVRALDIDVRERLARLSAESVRWHFENRRVFDAPDDEAARRALAAESLTAFDNLQRATRELERAIESHVNEGKRQTARTIRLQFWITLGLALVALASTLVVGLVSRRLRSLVEEGEQRRSEAVRARREMDALLEATGDGVLGIDLEGKCTSLNPVGRALLGFTEREVRGRDMHDLVHHSTADGAHRDRTDSPILAALLSGDRVDSDDDDVLWRGDRTSFPARWSLHPLVDGVELRGAVLTFTDISEIREKEAALRRAVHQREEVVSIVSHDLRNPLGVVAAAADLLVDLPLDEDERREQAQIIARSAGRMGRLIEALLDIARIEAGAFVVRPAAEHARPILDEARELFEGQAELAGIELLVDVESHVPQARMDRDRMLQALVNLLDNAFRFTAPGGTVTLAGAEQDGRVVLSVSDTGAGIAPEALDRLFDRFWQTPGHGGAGLGLAIVRGVMEAHGGTVEVDSRLGAGTTFRLLLPVTQVSAESNI